MPGYDKAIFVFEKWKISVSSIVTMEMCEIEFGGYFGEKGIYFQGDEVSGTLNYDHLQHKRITGKIVFIFLFIYLFIYII